MTLMRGMQLKFVIEVTGDCPYCGDPLRYTVIRRIECKTPTQTSDQFGDRKFIGCPHCSFTVAFLEGSK